METNTTTQKKPYMSKAPQRFALYVPNTVSFWQAPVNHVTMRQGCQWCYNDRRKTLVLEFGINDSKTPVMHGTKKELAYKHWTSMIRRCYSEKYHKHKPTYVGCTICDEWKYYSNFERWFKENFKAGFVLDKDILVKGNKVYSPDTCCFVPPHINVLLAMNNKKRGKLKLGVYLLNGKYCAQCGINRVQKRTGFFDNEDDAHKAYKKAKYAEIKRIATEALEKGDIDEKGLCRIIKL